MPQADLLVDLIKSASEGNKVTFRKITEDLIQAERGKGHRILADRLTKAMESGFANGSRGGTTNPKINHNNHQHALAETVPERSLKTLTLPEKILQQIQEVIEEQHRSELLHAYNLKARHKILLAGSPGNGKTTLAEVIAYEMMYPLFTVRYENLVGSFLGETASRLKNLFDYVKTRRCVLFFDEFETLGKERGDIHETGEIKRVMSSLLLQIDALPDYVVVVVASNHPELLDKAVWRRFQFRLNISRPTREQLSAFIQKFSSAHNIDFGYAPATLAKYLKDANFAEAEEFCLSVIRRSVLEKNTKNSKKSPH